MPKMEVSAALFNVTASNSGFLLLCSLCWTAETTEDANWHPAVASHRPRQGSGPFGCCAAVFTRRP